MNIFIQKEEDSIPEVTHEEMCISCGHCVAICPGGAISHKSFPEGSIKPVNQDIIPSIEQILELLRTRRSIRVFKDKKVEKELIEKIIDGARFAPSAHNVQSTEFLVIQDKDILNRIIELTISFLKGISHPDYDMVVNAVQNGRDQILHNAPVLLVFHAEKNHFSDVNATLALHNASLVIEGLGLGSFYTGYVIAACKHDKSIQSLLSIPKNHQIYGALALGYPKFEFKNWIERRPPKIEWV